MAFDIDAALRYVVEREGSDLHVKVASPPMARIHGALRPIDDAEPLTGGDGRLGEVEHAAGDVRTHQLDPLAPRGHPGGPDRVPAPGQALDHQPARGWSGHRELRQGDAPGVAPGP